MCYAASCNPTCGRCRPRRIVEASCPACGTSATITREEYLLLTGLPHKPSIVERKIAERGVDRPVCRVCGADLLEAFEKEVPPMPCTLIGAVCGFPCGRRDEEPPAAAGPYRCPTAVPLSEVASKGKTLKKGTDYTLAYKNNKRRGTATITVKGKGNIKGSKAVKFKIK